MQSIYGTGASNVYVVGHSDVKGGRMYHYDGQQWRVVDLNTIPGELAAIRGTGPDDIWIAGAEIYYDPLTTRFSDSSMVVRFDGNWWSKLSIPKSTGLMSISVCSRTQVWAGSSSGALLRYDGVGWTKFELGRELFVVSVACISPTEVYCVANREEWALPVDSAAYFLYKFDGTTWTALDTVWQTPGSPPAHFSMSLSAWDGQLFSLSPNIYRHTYSGWELVTIAEVGQMWKNSADDIFAAGRGLYHFDGSQWARIRDLSPVGVGLYSDSNEVFIVGNDNWRTIIVHGR